MRREHSEGLSQVSSILRAERSSAPTDLRRNVIDHRYVRREHAEGLSQVSSIWRAERSSAPTDHHRKNLYSIPDGYRNVKHHTELCRKNLYKIPYVVLYYSNDKRSILYKISFELTRYGKRSFSQ